MSVIKRCVLALGAVLVAGVVVAVALGQDVGRPQMAVVVNVTPNTAGTPSRPRGVEFRVRGTVDPAGDIAALMPASVDVWFPKGWRYNGAKHPVCALATLAKGGPRACPTQSIMGGGEFGHRDPGDGDSTFSHRDLTVINGGQTKMHFWLVIRNPARVQAAVTGTLTKPSSRRWSYRLHADIPSSLQIISGIPVALDYFRGSFGRGDWLATTSCPGDNRWRYRIKFTYISGQVATTDGAVACRG